ncbi:MAG TPA: hypothetical protein VFN19_07260 [Candidatus Nanopelagicales bacterium]|nr:hypothetical protein [Candidatus Nanopelagicales bacterium]
MLDAIRGYGALAIGVTEATARKAWSTAGSLLSGDLDEAVPSKEAAAGAVRAAGSQVQDLADDLVTQATTNRELLVGMVRTEVDRAAGRLGFVREEELAAVRRHVNRLEGQLTELRGTVDGLGGATAPAPAPKPAAKKKVPVKKAGTEGGPS